MKKFEIWLGLLRIPVDAIAAFCAFLIARNIRTLQFVEQRLPIQDLNFFEAHGQFYDYLFPLIGLLIVVLALNNLYSLKTVDTYSVQVKNIFTAVLVWTMTIITYYFLVRDFPFSRFVLLIGAVLVFLFVCFGRLFMHLLQNYLLRKGIGVRRLIVFGTDSKSLKRALAVFENDYRYKIVGRFDSEVDLKAKLNDFDNIVQIGNDKKLVDLDLLNFSRFYHKQYQYIPDIFEVQSHNIQLSEVKGVPIFTLRQTPLDGWWRVVKRIFDLFCSSLGLLILSPLLIFVAILIKLDSKGPILFKYLEDGSVVKRIGYKGKAFYCYKFRTMEDNSHSKRYNELADKDFRKGSPLVKIQNDPRVTNLGKVLRRLDIDELPQLINVLLGEMSLVGPRPHLTEEVEKYDVHHRMVLNIKPGITGLAQVSGRSDLEFEDEVRLDTYYIENWSLWLDLKILFKTVLVVFRGHREIN
jgi:exopolysaccharide biosynthesis polyprenyl glycosylphosphotransferase